MGDVVEFPKKRCAKCGHPKHRTMFSKDARRSDGKRSVCKTCDSRRLKKAYDANPDEKCQQLRDRYHTDAAYREAKRAQARLRRRELHPSQDTSGQDRCPIDIGGESQLRGVA